MSKTLLIGVVGARDLPRQQKSNEYTDKYCLVSVGDQRQKTSTKTSSQNVATWGETLQYLIGYENKDDEISVTVYVKWKLYEDRIGEIRLPVSQFMDIPRKFATENWYHIGTGDGELQENPIVNSSHHGEIGVIIGTYDGDVDEDENIRNRRIKDVDDPFYDNIGADEIYMEANQVAKDNKDTVDRIIKVAEETRKVGTKTVSTLQEQSEKLQQVEDDVEIVHRQITVGEKKLRGIDSCFCCCCADCFGGEQDAMKAQLKKQQERNKQAEATRQKARQDAIKERQEMDQAKARRPESRAGPAPKHRVKQEIFNQEQEFNKTNEQIDKGLDKVEDLVTDLKILANQMSTEIDNHNNRLETLNMDVNMEANRLSHVTNKTTKLT